MENQGDHSLESYLSIARAVAGELDFQKVLHRIAGEVRAKIIPYDHMDVAIISPDRSGEHVAFEVGMNTGWGEGARPRPIAQSPIRDLLVGKVSFMVTGDAWTDPRFHFDRAFDAPIFDADLHARIHVPLTVHGKVHGSLNISSHQCDVYTDQDLAAARNIADLIAPYFYAISMSEQARTSALAEGSARGREEALRTGALRLTEAMEKQRQTLGMELHDQTLADLSLIYRQVTQLARKEHVSTSQLAKLGDNIARCTTELRRIIENAKPGVLELFGLQQAIEAQLERAVDGIRPKINAMVTDETDGILDKSSDTVRTSAFRIVQEAVTNAVKHSECRNLGVTMTLVGKSVQIAITNDGNPPPAGWQKSTRGIDNMRVRAALVSATIRFVAPPDAADTSVILTIPLKVLKEHENTRVKATKHQHKPMTGAVQ